MTSNPPNSGKNASSFGEVYQRLSEAEPKTLKLLNSPTPPWLDREYPYVPPPDRGGTIRELQFLRTLIPERQENSEFILRADEDFLSLYCDLCKEIGAPFDEKSLKEIISESSIWITKLKWLYNRPRPYQVAERLGIQFTQMGTKTANTPSYPGGHTIQSYLVADFLSERAPQHRELFMDLASKISWSRALGGYHWPSDLIFGKSLFQRVVNEGLPLSVRVAAKFKKKREVPRSDGKGTTTIYEYSERQVANRHKEKAKRIEALRKNMSDLRAEARKDLDSEDPKVRLTALAVCLMDETYERVGNSGSAENGHFGVTTWKVEHVKVSPKKAVITYVGKSGVDHEKEVTQPKVLAALKKALEGKKKTDNIFCEGDDCTVSAKDVNEYLKTYDVTAKDIRGLHANEEMRRNLKKVRSEGGALPKDKKEKEKVLKEEFKKALEISAEAVGHEPATLRGQYLVPGLEDEYLKNGEVIEKLDKKASLGRVLYFAYGSNLWPPQMKERLPSANPVGPAVLPDHELGYFRIGGEGHANAVPRQGGKVEGFLFSIKESELQDLDLDEGVPLSHYRRGVVKVYDVEGKPLHAVTYLAPSQEPEPPSEEYQMKIDLGRQYWNLGRSATLSQSEKDDRETERLVQPSPKKKPPRNDLRRNTPAENEKDPDKEQDRKDRSNNYKDASENLKLNTSNPNKLREFQRLGLHGLEMIGRDLKEPDADPLTVIRSKASQMGPNVIVEDTSLDVAGEDVGVNVKWLMDSITKFVGKKAVFRVLLGVLRGGSVEVYVGEVRGTLVTPRGSGFGFDPVFLPEGSTKTLGEEKSDRFNARALAVKSFLNGRPKYRLQPLFDWEGTWQGEAKNANTSRVAWRWLQAAGSKLITVRRKEDGKTVRINEDTLREKASEYEEIDKEDSSEDTPDSSPTPLSPEEARRVKTDALKEKYLNLGVPEQAVKLYLKSVRPGTTLEEDLAKAEKNLRADSLKGENLLKLEGGLDAIKNRLKEEYQALGVSERQIKKSIGQIQEGATPEELDEIKGFLEETSKNLAKRDKFKEEYPTLRVTTPLKVQEFKTKAKAAYSGLGLKDSEIEEVFDKLRPGAKPEEVEALIKEVDEKIAQKEEARGREENKKYHGKARENPINEALKSLPDSGPGDKLKDYLLGLSQEEFDTFTNTLNSEYEKYSGGEGDASEFEKAVKKDLSDLGSNKAKLEDYKDPEVLGKALARMKHKETLEGQNKEEGEGKNDPTFDAENPLPEKGAAPSSKDDEEALKRAVKSVDKYSNMSKVDRESHYEKITEEMDDLEPGDPRRKHLDAIRKGIGVASALVDGKEAKGLGATMSKLITAADLTGNLEKVLSLGSFGKSPEEISNMSEEQRIEESRKDQELIRDVYSSVNDEDWEHLLPEDHPARDLAELLGSSPGRYLDEQDREEIRDMLKDLLVAEMEFLDPEVERTLGPDATVAQRESSRAPSTNRPRRDSALSEWADWIKNLMKQLAQSAENAKRNLRLGANLPSPQRVAMFHVLQKKVSARASGFRQH